MNTNIAEEFNRSLQKFKARQNTLPEKIRWKLNYIATMLRCQKCDSTSELPLEYQLEVSDLQGVNEKGLMVIFNAIVQTLFDEQIAIDKQCLIRKKGFFKSWSDGFIKYDQKYIYFNCANKTSRYRLKNVDIKLNNSSKRAFDFFYKGVFYMTIKFQKPQSMAAMFKTVKNSILREKSKHQEDFKGKKRQEQKEKEKTSSKGNGLVSVVDGNRNIPGLKKETKKQYSNVRNNQGENQSGFDISLQKQLSQPQKASRRLEYEESIFSEKQSSQILRGSKSKTIKMKSMELGSVEEGFQLKKFTKNGYIALSPEEGRLVIEVILNLVGNATLNQVASCLALYSNWSSKVQQEEVVYTLKLQGKTIIYRVYEKGNSFFSRCRETYTLLECRYLNNNKLLMTEQSLENEDRKEVYTRAYLNSVFYVQLMGNQCKIVVESSWEAKGYSNIDDSNSLLLAIYSDLLHFENFFNEFKIKQSPNQEDLFCLSPPNEVLLTSEQTDTASEVVTERVSKSMEELDQVRCSSEEEKDISLSLYRKSSKKDPFSELRPNSPLTIPTHEYLNLVRHKEYQRYYLKHSFRQEQHLHYQDYVPWYCLEQMLKTGGHYEVTPNLQLKFINQKLIQSQKDILRFVIKQIGANLISGKSVLNVSLPVDIFEPRTLLERSAASLGKGPDYLLRVSESQPLEQIKNVTAFLATVPTLELVMQKPFNPILGETFQCYLKGIPLCYEQISHHPPISSYYMKCKGFQLYGNLIAFADVGLNSGVGGNLGVMHIKFLNGYHYECYFPPSQISGLIYGDRKFRSYGRGYVLERSQHLFAQFSIEKPKKGVYETKQKLRPGSIVGGIFRTTEKFLQFLDQYKQNLKKFPGISKEHIVEKLVKISGIWFDKIYMDSKEVTEGIRAYPVQYSEYSLPSDANFRLDVLYHKQNNLPESQKEKEILENLQRQDRKLRERLGRKS